MNKALIVGCGRVGRRIAKLLDTQGVQVWTVNRNITTLPDHYRRLTWNIGSDLMSVDLPVVFDAVFYCPAPDQRSESAYEKIYVKGLRQIQNTLSIAKTVVFASSTGVYHQAQGEEVDETSPTQPTRFSGKIMLQAEQTLFEITQASCVVRLSGLYDHTSHRMDRLLQQPEDTDFSRISNRIHLQDAARLMIFAAQEKLKGIYVGSDPHPTVLWDIASWYATQNNVSFEVPRPNDTTNKYINSARIQSLGFSFEYPSFKEGLA